MPDPLLPPGQRISRTERDLMNWKMIRILDTYGGVPLLYLLRCLRGACSAAPRPQQPFEYKKILLIKFWGIGNIFMLLPSISALKQRYPHAAIDLLTLKSNTDAALSTNVFFRVFTIDAKGLVSFVATTLRTLKLLQQQEYDCIIDFEQFAKFSAIFTALIGKKATVGFHTQGKHRHFFYSFPVAYDNNVHITRSYFALAHAAGADNALFGAAPLLAGNAGSMAPGRGILDKLGIRPERVVIVMHVGTSDNFKERRWPAASYATLANLLIEHQDVQIVMTGLREEGELAAEIRGMIRAAAPVVLDAVGALNFNEYRLLLQMCDLIISADTAPVHLASAAGTPVVGLYGPNTPHLYGPWGGNSIAFYHQLDCSPCITNFNAKIHTCRHPEGRGACMKRISPEEVYTKVVDRYFEQNSIHRLKKLAQREHVSST